MSHPLPVLVAEDDPDNRLLLKIALGREGFNVDMVEDGEALLEAAATKLYRLIITDIRMPALNGDEAVRALRRGDAGDLNRHTYVVALTARAFAEDKARALSSGIDQYLTKPVDLQRLINAITPAGLQRTA